MFQQCGRERSSIEGLQEEAVRVVKAEEEVEERARIRAKQEVKRKADDGATPLFRRYELRCWVLSRPIKQLVGSTIATGSDF